MSYHDLTLSFDGASNVVTGTIYVILFTCVCIYLSTKFYSTLINFEHIILIGLLLIKTLCFSISGIAATYGEKNCGLFYLTRLAYFCTFITITYTYYHWCNVFCENEMKVVNMTIVKWAVIIMNLIVFIAVSVAYLYYLAQGTHCRESETFAVRLNTWTITSCNSFVALFCLSFTIYLIYAYRKSVHHFVSLQSKKSFGIVIICSFILVFDMCIRIAFHLYKPITHTYMNDILFRSGTYYIPDIIEYTVILIMWNLDAISEAVSKHDEKSLINYSQNIIRNITMRYFDESDLKNKEIFSQFIQPPVNPLNKADENDEYPIQDESYRLSRVLPKGVDPKNFDNEDNPDVL